MERIEEVGQEEEEDYEGEDYYTEEEEEGDEGEGEVSDISYAVSDEITLHQPELCAIYTAIHWAWKSDGTPWSDVEIKQLVGHAILKLDEDTYSRFDLWDVIRILHRNESGLTRDVRPIAENLKENFMVWIPQQYEKYLDMCRKDER